MNRMAGTDESGKSGKYVYRFRVKHDISWGWHIGVHFCVAPIDNFGKREVYLFLCVGKHDFSIGFMTEWEDSK